MPYLEYVGVEFANKLINYVSPDVLFPTNDSYNTEAHAAVTGNNSWSSVTGWLSENKLDMNTVRRNGNNEEPEMFPEVEQPGRKLNKPVKGIDDGENEEEIRFDDEADAEDEEAKAEKKAAEINAAREELDRLLNDPQEGYIHYLEQLKRCGGNPDKEEEESEVHEENWKQCIDAFAPDKVKELQDALELYNEKTECVEIYKPKMQALCGLVRGITKLSIELQQEAAGRDAQNLNTALEKADFSSRAEEYEIALEKLKEHSHDGKNRNIHFDFKNIGQDLEEVKAELKAVVNEKEKYQAELEKIEKAPGQARQQKEQLKFQICYFRYGMAEAALHKAKDDKAPKEKISELEKAGRNARAEAVQVLKDYRGLGENDDPQSDVMARMDIQIAKNRITKMKAENPELSVNQIFEKLIENAEKDIEKQNAVIEKAKKGDDPEIPALQECLKAYETKEEYLRDVKKQLTAADKAYQNVQKNFGGSEEAFKENEEFVDAYKAAEKTCGIQRIDYIMKRMQVMYTHIGLTREDGHSDSNEFTRMEQCLRAAAAPLNGKVDQNGNVSWEAKGDILKNIQESAEHYLREKKKGFIHRKENVMRNYRMTFARELIELAKEARKYAANAVEESRDYYSLKTVSASLEKMTDRKSFDKTVEKTINPLNVKTISYQTFAKQEVEKQNQIIQKTREQLEKVRNQGAVKENAVKM